MPRWYHACRADLPREGAPTSRSRTRSPYARGPRGWTRAAPGACPLALTVLGQPLGDRHLELLGGPLPVVQTGEGGPGQPPPDDPLHVAEAPFFLPGPPQGRV